MTAANCGCRIHFLREMDMMSRALQQPRLMYRWQEARRCSMVENRRWLEGHQLKIYLDGVPLIGADFPAGQIERETLLIAATDDNQNIVGGHAATVCVGETNKLL